MDDPLTKQASVLDYVEVLGIHDDQVIEGFMRLGFSARTAPAIEMVPVLFVAWANGSVSGDECVSAISGIHDAELAEFPETWSVIQDWLDVRPSQELWDLWTRYTWCRLDSLSSSRRAALNERLLSHGRRVARASGGLMGIGSICLDEQVILDAIAKVFVCHDSSRPRNPELLVG
ncbi:MAG: hypothetical protein Aurels2KO_27940 [Aureliella sp.]